jgi:hypothetical protein
VRRNAARAIANLVETTLAMPVSADIFKISRRLRSPIEQVAMSALLKNGCSPQHPIARALAAVKLDPGFTGSVRRRLIRPLRPARFMRDALLAALFFVQTMFS